MVGQDFQIIKDDSKEGVRHITAIPSMLVCSSQIDFDIIDGKLHNVVYQKGCHGNLIAIGRLLEGMDAEKAAAILEGVDCHGRGTACSDQLSKVLKSL